MVRSLKNVSAVKVHRLFIGNSKKFTRINNIPARIFGPASPLLLPYITRLVNVTFSAGIFSDCLKWAPATLDFESRIKSAVGSVNLFHLSQF